MTNATDHSDDDSTDTGDSELDAIAAELGEVPVSDGYLEEREIETGEQFGYEK